MPKVSRAHLLEERSMPWSGELLIPRSERELRRSEGSGKLIDDPLVEGSNAGSTNRASDLSQSSGGRRNSLLRVRPPNHDSPLSRERHAQRWPSNEGRNASSTYNELWRAEHSFLRMRGPQLPIRSSRAENSLLRVRGNSDAPKGAACS